MAHFLWFEAMAMELRGLASGEGFGAAQRE